MVRTVNDRPNTKNRYPKGYLAKAGYMKIAVSFRTANFSRILSKAKEENKSFSVVVDEIVTRHFEITELARAAREAAQ